MKHFFKNNKGMTYVELLVAFTLLVLIVFVFSPMLLSSYGSLYEAGTKVEDTYKAKSEIEEGLAERLSTKIIPFNANFENFITNVDIKGRKIASSYQENLETMFRGARARVDLVSPSTVYDDASYHDVTIQTTNIAFENCNVGYSDPGAGSKDINIGVLFPDKTAGTNAAEDEMNVYNYSSPTNKATVKDEDIKYNAEAGRITFRIKDCDFTKSPIKITVFFRDEKDKPQSVSCFLYIKAPTIMAVGKTSGGDYYTTAGVQTQIKHNTNGSTEDINTFTVENRTMPTANSSLVQGNTPKDNTVTLQNVSFINNDSDGTLDPYYVITGDKGAVYRMYILKNSATTDSTKNLTTTDKVFKLSDGSKVYPALWSGDNMHEFYYASGYREGDYGAKGTDREDDHCWKTETGNDTGLGTSTFSAKAKYSYFWNGMLTEFENNIQNRRNISYILADWGVAQRFFGRKNSQGDFDGYQIPWNTNIVWGRGSSWEDAYYASGDDWRIGLSDYVSDAYAKHNAYATIAVRSMSTGDIKTMMTDIDNTDDVKAFFRSANTDYRSTTNVIVEDAAFIPSLGKVLYLGTANANAVVTQLDNAGEGTKVKFAEEYKKDDAPIGSYTMYAIMSDGDNGTTIYKASEQNGKFTDIITAGDNPKFKTGGTTTRDFTATYSYHYTYSRAHNSSYTGAFCWCEYVGVGYQDIGLYLKHSRNKLITISQEDWNHLSSGERSSWSRNNDPVYSLDSVAYAKSTSVATTDFTAAENLTKSTNVITDMDTSNNFFVSMTPQDAFFPDLYYTLGFSSVREYIYAQISYGKVDGKIKEQYKSYEQYYFLSHYGNAAHSPSYTVENPQNSSNYSGLQNHSYWNSYDNDYYNVWFPGECYNLTQTATRDDIVVSVGYAVSGGAYQWIDNLGSINKNTSTALGGIFNDGVLAVCTPKDTSMVNKLYFKDNATMDTDYLSDANTNTAVTNYYPTTTSTNKFALSVGSAKTYSDAFGGNYGTHARKSVRFTAVDLMVESTGSGSTENKSYYAYYGDSTGRVFKSLVATASATGSASSGGVNAVSYIADLSAANSVKNAAGAGKMEQIKLSGLTGNDAETTKYFSEIVSITAGDDLVVITGKPQPGVAPCVVVGHYEETKDTDGEIVRGDFVWKVVHLIGSGYDIQDGVIVNGYYYACGVKGSSGFVLAADLETLKKAAKDATVSGTMVATTTDPLYSISGRA